MKNKIIIETARLILRETDGSDFPELMQLFSDPVAMRFFPGIKTDSETRDWIKENQNRYKRDGIGFYTCVNKTSSEVVGYCGLALQEDVAGKDEIEIGYGLIRHFWQNGYATEAAIACKKYGFEKFKLEKLISLIRPENVASKNVAVRNGMTWEKNIERWDYLHGVYSISRDEYLQSASEEKRNF